MPSLLREASRELVLGLRASGGRFDPGFEVLRRKVGEGEEQIRKIALHIEHQHRHASAQRFLDEHPEQPRLAAAGHPRHDGMRR